MGGCSVGPSPKDAGLAELEVKSPSIGQTRFSGLETPGGATSRHFWRFRPSVGFHVFGPCPIGGGATERRRLGLFASLTPTARWLRGRLLVRGAVTVRLLPQDRNSKKAQTIYHKERNGESRKSQESQTKSQHRKKIANGGRGWGQGGLWGSPLLDFGHLRRATRYLPRSLRYRTGRGAIGTIDHFR